MCTETEPVVTTVSGKLRGYKSDDVYCFKGIEYARAKRFQMPEPAESWNGVKDALSYGPGCPEMTFSIEGKPDFDHIIMPGRFWSCSENCLNLNVWTKSVSPAAKRPVMVWLHGGGYAGGSATHLYSYDGYEMADNYDVVLITVNHRLNMLGFLDLSEFGDRYKHSGILGIADLVAALEWVKENIAAFGGDPDNVTIYGQSGGGGKVTTLMQMPAADGLYHKAIIQSGIMRDWPDSPEHRLPYAEKAAEILGLTRDTIQEIETMDYETVAAAVRKASSELGGNPMSMWKPISDGEYYIGAPFDVGFRKETSHIPLIVGSCISEFVRSPTGNKAEWTDEKRYAALKEMYGDGTEEVRGCFEEAYPELDWSYAACVDTRCRPAIIDFLNKRREEAEAPVYNYIFTFESPFMGGLLPGHNSDLHFMFHNALYMDAMCKPGVTERLQDEMAGAWAQFAYAGNPNRAELAMWEAYTPENGACLALGDKTVLKHQHDCGLLKALDKHTSKVQSFI
jgi:para-nitrobenzyl esterase